MTSGMNLDQLETGPIAAITVYSGQVWRAWKVPRNALEDISLGRRAGNISVPGDLLRPLIGAISAAEFSMRFFFWAVLGACGLGIMCYGYATREQAAPQAAWAHGMIAIGPTPPAGELMPGGATPVLLRLVSGSPLTQGVLDGMAISVPEKVQSLRLQLQPKLVAVHFKGLGIDEKSLESGRLPSEQGGEALAGPGTANLESIVSGNTTFKVVGRLKRDFGLFEKCYLASVTDADAAMTPEASGVHTATLLQLPPDKLRDPKVVEQIEKVFPTPKYTRLVPQDRLDSRAFFTYLGGLAAFLLGGSGALISIYRGLGAPGCGDGDCHRAGRRRI